MKRREKLDKVLGWLGSNSGKGKKNIQFPKVHTFQKIQMKRKKEMDEMLGWLESMRCFFSPASLWNADLHTAPPTHTLVLCTSAQLHLRLHNNMKICISTPLCTCIYRTVGNSSSNKKILYKTHFIMLLFSLSFLTITCHGKQIVSRWIGPKWSAFPYNCLLSKQKIFVQLKMSLPTQLALVKLVYMYLLSCLNFLPHSFRFREKLSIVLTE